MEAQHQFRHEEERDATITKLSVHEERTDSTEQDQCWGSNSSSASQDVYRVLWKM